MIGITERGDPIFDHSWINWVNDNRPAILITKNPGELRNIINTKVHKNPNIIIHCSITGWAATELEPNVPYVEDSLDAYYALINEFGGERVVLRIDPIIPTKWGIAKAIGINSNRKGRVRISFLDNYQHIKEKFNNKEIINLIRGSEDYDPDRTTLNYDFHCSLELRIKTWERMKKPEVCGEPGMQCTGCISERDCDILGVTPTDTKTGLQRKACMCIASEKHELLLNKKQCKHGCLYCYWKS